MMDKALDTQASLAGKLLQSGQESQMATQAAAERGIGQSLNVVA
jgi:hypothetical protein